jgi:hypothetical protein
MAEQSEPINCAVFEYKQENSILKAKSASFTTIDDAIWELIHGLDHLQKEKGLVFEVIRIYSEWKPTDELLKVINSMYPKAQLTYSFTTGDEEKFKQALKDIKTDSSTKFPTKKWWQIWK